MQTQRTVLRQEMRQKMSTQLLQSINLLALPITELKQQIQEELDKNPALEIAREKEPMSLEDLKTNPETERSPFANSSDPGFTPRSTGEGDTKRMFMEGALSKPENLHDHLMWQLRLQPLDEAERELGELLVMNLDDRGFHSEPPEEFVPPRLQPHMGKICNIIRSLDPIGTCTADYMESLKVQMQILQDFPLDAQKIVLEGFDLLEKGEFGKLARKVGLTQNDVVDLLEDIRRLNPFPGREFSQVTTQYVVPDILVIRRDGEFFLRVNDEDIPVLQVESFFEEQSVSIGNNDKKASQFIKKSVKDAKWFINSLDHRRSTLARVAEALSVHQRDFFHKGLKALKPLTLKDIAGELDLSEATISRITSNKYIQTEWGIFELKYFFTNSISGSGSDGSSYSKEAVKEIIREIIVGWNEDKKLSDQRISDLLSQRGIEIARRTVSKYRKEFTELGQNITIEGRRP